MFCTGVNKQNLIYYEQRIIITVMWASNLPCLSIHSMFPLTDFPTRLLKGIRCAICLPQWSNINHKEHQHHHETHSSPLGNLCIQCYILHENKGIVQLIIYKQQITGMHKRHLSKSYMAALSGLFWLLTSFNRPSSCLLRLPFSHLSTSFSDMAICRRASSESRYSFFFFRDSDADSRFFIIRCCRWETFDWKRWQQRRGN